jgi:cobalt-zinc-cadmium efflux system membrane fusion protein
MTGRPFLVIISLVIGVAVASLVPGLSEGLRTVVGFSPVSSKAQQEPKAAGPEKAEASEGPQSVVKLTQDEIEAAGIELAVVQSGTIAHRIVLPGAIIPHADRIARVAVKLSGTVAELRKRIGDPVSKDEVLAVLESREVAEAKSEYLAARLTNELQQDLFEREKILWDKKISTEQQFLRSRNQAAQAKMRSDITRQKLFALGLTEPEIANLPKEPEASLRRQEVRAPIAGRVVERKVDLGMAVGRDNLETELFVIADLDRVWVELAASPADLPAIKEGQPVSVAARGIPAKADGTIVFISPMLDKETRSARIVAEIGNSDGVWRPGSFVTAGIAVEEQSVSLAAPTSAIQTMGDAQVTFVRTSEGFQKRPVIVGQSDGRIVEVVSGLRHGDTIAVSNTFLLKAELLKALAED